MTNSVQNIENVEDISFTIYNDPIDPMMKSKFTIVATNTDNDMFTFVFKGNYLIQTCKKAGLFDGWEKDQKIREKNRKINEISNRLQEVIRDKRRSEYRLEEKEKENKDLQHKYNIEKAANEAQHKFFRQYAGKGVEIDFNYAIDDAEEVSYVVVDKEEYEALKNSNKNCIPTKILDRVAELEKLNKDLADSVLKSEESNKRLSKELKRLSKELYSLKQIKRVCENSVYGLDPVSGNVINIIEQNEYLKGEVKRLRDKYESETDNKPLTRADILHTAEKCVCGQREQDYGTPESNFQLIADLWNGYLGFMDHPGWQQIQATDVAMMMALMKIARIRNGGGSGDSFVDLAGYAACGGEIWYGRKKQVPEGE